MQRNGLEPIQSSFLSCEKDVEIIIYEPTIKGKVFEEIRVENDLDTFKNESDVIIANRINEEIEDERPKIYTRDIFTRD